MDKQQAAHDIITATLPIVAFDGWTMRALTQGAVASGYKKTDVIRVFPNGAMDAVNFYHEMCDKQLATELAGYNLDTMKIRQKITLAVRLRIENHTAEKEAIRRAVQLNMLPFNLHHASRNLYSTVDTIWRAINDKSTDFNFYSKRATLAAVYTATLLFWLNDDSMRHQATWDFLYRRIENIMQFEKLKVKIKNTLG